MLGNKIGIAQYPSKERKYTLISGVAGRQSLKGLKILEHSVITIKELLNCCMRYYVRICYYLLIKFLMSFVTITYLYTSLVPR